MKELDPADVISQIVDFVLPELTPYELSFYLFLLRNSHIKHGTPELRVGKRTIAQKCGRGTRADASNFAHVTKVLNSLEAKGCIEIGDTNREGTLYRVRRPSEVPFVAAMLQRSGESPASVDFFGDPEKRRNLFDRDGWLCHYCGERVTEKNATLDHYVPVCQGGTSEPDNLFTSCLLCNSVKSGKSYESAAPLILKSIRDRAARRQDQTKSREETA